MYDYAVTCLVCGNSRSTDNLSALPDFSDDEVLALASHSADCPVGLSDPRAGTVTHYQRPGEPNTMLYEIAQVA